MRIAILAGAVLLGGCAGMAPVAPQRAPVVDGGAPAPERAAGAPAVVQPVPLPEPIRSTPLPDAEAAPSAQAALMAAADQALLAGNSERAAALIERALRMAPRDAQLWLRLASIRAQQGRQEDAIGLARRALGYAGADNQLRRRANELIDAANRARGVER